MKHIIDPIVKTTSDVTEVAKRIVEDGVEFFRGTLGKLPLFSSVIARESKENITHDETHYFLVPYRLSEVNYALYTQRVLPEGVGPENDLPKAKIFHLPAVGTLDTLEELLFEQLSAKHRQQYSNELPIADRLDLIAKEIDKQSNLVTGGLVLIGGAVAIANPLVGVGIAAKALLPTLGSKLSKHGINHVTDWLRDKNGSHLTKLQMPRPKRKSSSSQPRLKPMIHLLYSKKHLQQWIQTTTLILHSPI